MNWFKTINPWNEKVSEKYPRAEELDKSLIAHITIGIVSAVFVLMIGNFFGLVGSFCFSPKVGEIIGFIVGVLVVIIFSLLMGGCYRIHLDETSSASYKFNRFQIFVSGFCFSFFLGFFVSIILPMEIFDFLNIISVVVDTKTGVSILVFLVSFIIYIVASLLLQ